MKFVRQGLKMAELVMKTTTAVCYSLLDVNGSVDDRDTGVV